MSDITEIASAVKPDRDAPLLAALRAIVGDAPS